MSRALIIFTREPEAGTTKTRMMPVYDPEECKEMHKCFLMDIYSEVSSVDADLIICYTSKNDTDPKILYSIFGSDVKYIRQTEGRLEERMYAAVKTSVENGYESCVLIGTDIPEMKEETIKKAFSELRYYDIVLSPTYDGGYCLIGMNDAFSEPFKPELAKTTYLEATVNAIKKAKLSYLLLDVYCDMDEPEDLKGYIARAKQDGRLLNTHTAFFLNTFSTDDHENY